MKTLKLFFFLCLFSAWTVQAQQTQQGQNKQQLTPEQKAQNAANHLTKKLGLSADQAGQVYTITLAHVNKMQALRANKANGQKQGPAIKQAKNDYDAAINGILTPTQQQTWAQLLANEQAKRNAKKQQNGSNQNNNINQPDSESEDYNGGMK